MKVEFVPPMLARLVPKLPEGPEWIYEAKWDGYRIQAIKEGKKVRLLSRRGSDFTQRFNAAAAEVAKIKARHVVIDGEVTAVNAHGQPSFQDLQNNTKRLPEGFKLIFFVFDLLWLEGKDWRRRPLKERRERLCKLVEGTGLAFSGTLRGTASEVLRVVQEHGLEGVVAKREDSFYESGERSGAWVKQPLKPKDEFVIGGYRLDGGMLDLFVAGQYVNGKLEFKGKVRQGFNPLRRKALLKVLAKLKSTKCPFVNLPSSGRRSKWGTAEGIPAEEMGDYVWLKPKVVADVRFSEWTQGGVLRHAEFVGIREDKKAEEVMGGGNFKIQAPNFSETSSFKVSKAS